VRRQRPAWWPSNRRQAQSGATLVELLVSVVIMGLALTLIIGTFSTGLLDASLAKRNTAAVGVVQYELDAPYQSVAASYSDCFATEDASSPPVRSGSFQGSCPSTSYTLRADVTVVQQGSTQTWSISVSSWPNLATVGQTVQTIKANR
jgi:type II secretory pathway pseudopilin PulG